MSMRDYAVNDYGLVLGEEIMKLLASKVCDYYSDNDFLRSPEYFLESMADDLGFDHISEFTGEVIPISDTVEYEWDWGSAESYNDDSIYYMKTLRYPSLFAQAYKDMNELIEEFKEILGGYLPTEFDYQAHLCHIVGTYFG